MIYYFRWEDILDGEVRRVKRVDAPGLNSDVEFSLADVAPTENVRVIILNDAEEHLGVILFTR